MQSGFIIGAASSGAGKTTFSLGLMRALTRRGVDVRPFKCGPDYIDTQFHEVACARQSINLDIFMSSEDHVRDLYSRYSAADGVNIIEGAMGLFDGYDGPLGSASHVAGVLSCPVILLVNAASAAYSVAATILGCRMLRPDIKIAGVVMNRVGSARHEAMLRRAADDAGVRWLGSLPKMPGLQTPSRHLGLTLTAAEEREAFINVAADAVENGIDIESLLDVTRGMTPEYNPEPHTPLLKDKVIGVAYDEAFNFIYKANLDSLTDAGARLEFFSPIKDDGIPDGIDALYLPGGYPELYSKELEANAAMRNSVADFASRGGRIYAECGGMLYLGRDIDGDRMCGILPHSSTMQGARLHLGYRQAEIGDSHIRGHEFHYSTVKGDGEIPKLMTQRDAMGRSVDTPIYRSGNITATYTHLYWANNPASIAEILS